MVVRLVTDSWLAIVVFPRCPLNHFLLDIMLFDFVLAVRQAGRASVHVSVGGFLIGKPPIMQVRIVLTQCVNAIECFHVFRHSFAIIFRIGEIERLEIARLWWSHALFVDLTAQKKNDHWRLQIPTN